MPPEAIEKKLYTADGATVWSIGVTIVTILTTQLPFNNSDDLKKPLQVSFIFTIQIKSLLAIVYLHSALFRYILNHLR